MSTISYVSLNVSYYRQLIGMDAADEFTVDWFNGTGWTYLEQLGGASADDAAYVAKSFVLPAEANNNPNFRIRFMCENGAVSESCRVDNVKITGVKTPFMAYGEFTSRIYNATGSSELEHNYVERECASRRWLEIPGEKLCECRLLRQRICRALQEKEAII